MLARVNKILELFSIIFLTLVNNFFFIRPFSTLDCPQSCLKCSSAHSCEICQPNMVFSDGRCSCPSDFLLDEDGVCEEVIYIDSWDTGAITGLVVTIFVLMVATIWVMVKKEGKAKEMKQFLKNLGIEEEQEELDECDLREIDKHENPYLYEQELDGKEEGAQEDDEEDFSTSYLDQIIEDQDFIFYDCNEFEVDDKVLIGKGGFSSVYRVRRDGVDLAVKQITIKIDNFLTVKKLANFLKKLFQEIHIIQRISQTNSPYLLKYHGLSIKVNKFYILELNLVSDLLANDLDKYIDQNYASLSFIQKLKICLQIIKGIERMQILRIIHGDIKPQNILLDSQLNFYIADYGTCRIIRYDETFLSQTLSATLRFAPPEMITNSTISFKVFYIIIY